MVRHHPVSGGLTRGKRRRPILVELIILFLLVLFGGVLAGAEIAIVALRKSRVDQLLEQGHRAARAVKKLQEDPERFFATAQIGITVLGAAAGAISGATLARDLAPYLRPLPGLGPYADQISLFLAVSFVSYVSIVLGELVPKSLALRAAEPFALLIGRPLLLLSALARPLVWFLTASSNVVLRLFGDRTTFTETRVSAEELQQMVGEATKGGSVDPAVGEIASRAIDFGELTAYDVMVPRSQVISLSRTAKPEEIQRILLEQGHTRMPVHDGNRDQVVGYVTVRDLLVLFWERGLVVLEDAIRPGLFIPETMRTVDILAEMRSHRVQLAIVVDEEGGMVGIVTAEDLVEELVGDIVDEHHGDKAPKIDRRADNSVVLPATMPVREANRAFALGLPEGPGFTTLAGLVIDLAGRIPSRGARFTHTDGTEIEVIEATARRVVRIRLLARSKTGEPAPADSPAQTER